MVTFDPFNTSFLNKSIKFLKKKKKKNLPQTTVYFLKKISFNITTTGKTF